MGITAAACRCPLRCDVVAHPGSASCPSDRSGWAPGAGGQLRSRPLRPLSRRGRAIGGREGGVGASARSLRVGGGCSRGLVSRGRGGWHSSGQRDRPTGLVGPLLLPFELRKQSGKLILGQNLSLPRLLTHRVCSEFDKKNTSISPSPLLFPCIGK